MENDGGFLDLHEQADLGQNLLADEVRPIFSYIDMLMEGDYLEYGGYYDLVDDLPENNFEKQCPIAEIPMADEVVPGLVQSEEMSCTMKSPMGESLIAHEVVPAFVPSEDTSSMIQIAAAFGEEVSRKKSWQTLEETPEQNKDDASEVTNKRFRLTSSISNSVGQELDPTPAMAVYTQHTQFSKSSTSKFNALAQKKKLKASKFNASLLRIGSWEKKPIYPGQLQGKCYYGWKKMMWEIMENGYERKIEFSWSNISCMEAFPNQENPTRFTIWLKEAPAFYKELIGSKKKGTTWTKSEDFTEGQASRFRMHYLEFPNGEFGKSYINLLRSDRRLLALSKISFVSVPRPSLTTTIEEAPRQFRHCRCQLLQSHSSCSPPADFRSSLLSSSTQALPLQHFVMNNLPIRQVEDEGFQNPAAGNASTSFDGGLMDIGARTYPTLAEPWIRNRTTPFAGGVVNYSNTLHGNMTTPDAGLRLLGEVKYNNDLDRNIMMPFITYNQ